MLNKKLIKDVVVDAILNNFNYEVHSCIVETYEVLGGFTVTIFVDRTNWLMQQYKSDVTIEEVYRIIVDSFDKCYGGSIPKVPYYATY